MVRKKISKKRVNGILRGVSSAILAQGANYEMVLEISTSDYLRRRAMEFLQNNETDKALEMLVLDKILA